ncbi:MAG: glycosyltransferase [Pyrinomonadaceae bacterium]
MLSIIEATTVTGPAKALISFNQTSRAAAHAASGLPRIEHSIITFVRGTEAAKAVKQNEAPNQFVVAARAAGIEVDVIGERFRFDTRVIGDLRRIVAQRAPDIIESHMIKSHFLVKVSELGRRLPWVAFHHGYTKTDLKMQLYNRLNRWSLPSAARVVTVCGAFAEQLARAGVPADRIFVRHNAIGPAEPPDSDEVRALGRRLGISPDERMILAVGRMSREKGLLDLVSAVGELRRLNPELKFKLVIVGDGPERERVERLAAELDISERMVLAGHVDDVRAFYALAHVLALPSHSEGSPLVLLEAMAAGVPIVATRVGGVPEMVADGESALLVAPNDARSFAIALARLLRDPQLVRTLSANALKRSRQDFSPEAYARSLSELYLELLAGSRTRTFRGQAILN